jgi:hypothetical protein
VTVAALYVDPKGVYANLEGVEVWDEARDARLYAGPWPVVAHPPCARWCLMAPLNESQYGLKVGDDGGCFEAALNAVRSFGGVLEHPAYSFAWDAFGLPAPMRHGWTMALDDPGMTTEVSQAAYGHPARKRTWLYYVGPEPAVLRWNEPETTAIVSDLGSGGSRLRGDAWKPGVQYAAASATPETFRDALLELARSAAPTALQAAAL